MPNYLKIIVDSYTDKTTFKQFLDQYFVREIKKLQDQYYSIKEIDSQINSKINWLNSSDINKMDSISYVSMCQIYGFIIPKFTKEEIEHIRKSYSIATSSIDNRSSQLYGYITNLNHDQIDRLYYLLQEVYIDCTLKSWSSIFNSEIPINKGSIEWKKTNVLLAYFIKQLLHAVGLQTKVNF